MPKNASDRLSELDVLRGLAALGVVFFHYTTNYALRNYVPDHVMLFDFPWGKYGVHLFFMISGFVILMTLEKTSHILDFIISRFSRLYPAYWLAIFLTSMVIKYCLLVPSIRMQLPLGDVLINLSMMQSWFHVKDLDTVYWTLAVELSFYFLMALIFLANGIKYIEFWGMVWLALMLLNKYFNAPWPFVVSFESFFDSFLKYGNLFVAGILFYGLKSKGNRWWRHVGLGLCLLVQYVIWVDVEKQCIFAFLFFLFVFYLFVMGKLSFIAQKPLIFFGTISYTLYLIHQDIGYIILQWLFFFGRNPWLMFFVPLGCSLLIATLMTYLVEKPSLKLIRKMYKEVKFVARLPALRTLNKEI